MRWLVDECVDARIVPLLRADGHDVLHIADIGRGIADTNVLEFAVVESRLVLSEDKDFGDLVIRRRLQVPGVVLARVQPDALSFKWSRLQAAIIRFGDKLFGRYTVVEASRFRSRALPNHSRL